MKVKNSKFNIINANVIVILFLCLGIVKVSSMTAPIGSPTHINTYNESTTQMFNDHCECIKYDCGCCEHIEWDRISLNGTLCANASYLEHDYGISVTATFNDNTLINETISVLNPPPICIGENIINGLKVEVCLQVYDINIENDMFHACFKILGKFLKIKTFSIKLGCVNGKKDSVT